MSDIFAKKPQKTAQQRIVESDETEVRIGWWTPYRHDMLLWLKSIEAEKTLDQQTAALRGRNGKFYDTKKRAESYSGHQHPGAIPVYVKKDDLMSLYPDIDTKY